MPLSDHEQKILEEIERGLEKEDPRFANAVSRASLRGHAARRIRLGAFGFVAGFVMLMLVSLSVWVAIGGFGLMLVSALFVYHELRRMSEDQLREYGAGRGGPLTGLLARMTERFRRRPQGRP